MTRSPRQQWRGLHPFAAASAAARSAGGPPARSRHGTCSQGGTQSRPGAKEAPARADIRDACKGVHLRKRNPDGLVLPLRRRLRPGHPHPRLAAGRQRAQAGRRPHQYPGIDGHRQTFGAGQHQELAEQHAVGVGRADQGRQQPGLQDLGAGGQRLRRDRGDRCHHRQDPGGGRHLQRRSAEPGATAEAQFRGVRRRCGGR